MRDLNKRSVLQCIVGTHERGENEKKGGGGERRRDEAWFRTVGLW